MRESVHRESEALRHEMNVAAAASEHKLMKKLRNEAAYEKRRGIL
jgi:hypothetical protein